MIRRSISLVMALLILVTIIPTFAFGASLEHWTNRTTETPYLDGVSYGNGTYMAVGYGGNIWSSSDGESWTQQTSDTTTHLFDVAYGNNMFVAVGGNETILTSVNNGSTWVNNSMGGSEDIVAVEYLNGMFVAVGTGGAGGQIWTSADNGVTWVSVGSSTQSLFDVTYANIVGVDVFVAVGLNGAIETSTNNGATWSSQTSGTEHLISVTYNGTADYGRTFVAVGDNGAILTSADGITWTSQPLVSTNNLLDVTYGDSEFVAVGDKGTILTSSDGRTWTNANSGITDLLTGVIYGSSTYVAVGVGSVLLQNYDPVYVTYDDNGSSGGTTPTDSTPYVPGATVTVPGAGGLVKTNYMFAGWNTTADGDGTPYSPGGTYSITSNVTLYAQWTVNPTYTVTYNDNGSTGGTVPTDSNSYEQNATVTVLANTGSLVKTGNTFAGWYTAADGTGTSYAANATFGMGASNVTLYAQWTVNPTYTVTYNDNGSTGGTVPTDSNPYEQHATVTVLANTGSLVKTGNTFAGWNTAADGTGTSYAANATFGMGASNVTLYAQYIRVPAPVSVPAAPTYTVTYNGNGNTGGTVPTDNKSYGQNELITLLGNTGSLEKTDYAFAGWNTAADRSGKEYMPNAAFTMGSANVTLYAQWKIVPYTDISGHWAESNIIAISRDIVRGYPDNTFRPNQTVTRAEFAVMLINALKLEGTGTELTFTDKDHIKSWSEKEVSLAVELGIMKGYTDGSFRPDKEISRAEMAAIIATALKLTLDETAITGFTDDKDIPKWAKSSVVAVNKTGIMQGRGDNEFAPRASVTRAEAVTALLNMLAQ
ncbi:InlB B-repeat-containing protein [Paenibacillus sinopodophylli]|uniref:InlB B-repeat-containing protein n=1 Tax=Paenibacillus sinopodophylli TaxID=1837342 RepID=UPI00110C9AD7|nr:InlB B-repeat-containing protein [Paenibacillus sinopodophylli]